MRIAFNPSTVAALTAPPDNKDIIFDLRGQNIFARGVKFCGTDTNTWRDIKINNVSIDSNILDLRDGDNTTLTNINGVVTINSTWRPVVDNLTSDSTTSSLSANQGRILKALIDGKSDSDHNHDNRYVKKTGDTMFGALNFANGTWNLVGDDSYVGDCNISGHFGIKAANTTYPGIAFFNNSGTYLGILTAYSGNIKYGAYSLQFLDNGNTSVSASTWMNPFSSYNSNAVADGQAICVWGQSSQLSNLATDTGNMSLWLKRVNTNVATLNMVLDGEYYANGNQRLAHVSEIPNSLKNPYSLTTFGVVYDGSAAKTVTTSTFISQLEEGTSVVTDGTMFVTSWASDSGFADTNAVNVPYKRKAIHLWEYIKAKTDSLYAVIVHNHDDRYLKLTGGVLKGQIILPDIDVNTSYTGSIIIGASNTENLGIDGNEIMARNNGKASTLYLNNEGGVVQLGAILRTNSNIAYIGSQSTQNMIKFINNTNDPYGNGIAIGGGGLTIIGSGESSDVVMGQHSSGGDENMIIAGDGNIDFYSNLQDGWQYGKHMYLDTNGFLFTPSYINIGGNENNNSSPDRVWGSNSSDSYLRSYRTSALKVSYANNAGSVAWDNVTNRPTIPNFTNYYWANVKISASSSTTTSPTVSNLTATSSIKMSHILLEHTDEINNSANGGLHLNYRNSGDVSLCAGGGKVGIGTTSPVYKLHVNGNIYSSGQIIREGYSTIWAQGRNVALLRETSVSGYHTLWSLKTTNGSWDFGEFNTSGWNNVPVLSYITDSNYNSGNNVTTYQIKFPLASGTVALTSYGGDSSHPIFLGYLNLEHGNDGTVSSSFSCLGYTVPFTYTRGGNYCKIYIPDTSYQTFYIRAAIASVNYSGGGMDTWVGNHRGEGAWWLHCYASGLNEVRVKGFCQRNSHNDSWWGGNPLWSGNSGANRITVCIFGNVTFK